MTYFKIRCDAPVMDAYLDLLGKYGDVVLLVSEVAEKTKKIHYHGLFKFNNSAHNERTIERARKNYFSDNEDYKPKMTSIGKFETSHHFDNYLEYMMKGEALNAKPMIIFDKYIIDEAVIDKLHRDYWSKHGGDKCNSSGGKVRKNPEERKTKVQQFIDYIDEHGLTNYNDGWAIARLFVKFNHKNGYNEASHAQQRCYCMTVQRELCFRQGGLVLEKYLEEKAKAIIGTEWIYI